MIFRCCDELAFSTLPLSAQQHTYSRNLPHDPSLVALRGETAPKLYPRNNARSRNYAYPFWRLLRAKRFGLINHHSSCHIYSSEHLSTDCPKHSLHAGSNSRTALPGRLHISCTLLASMYIQQRIKFKVHTYIHTCTTAYPNTRIRGERGKKETIRKKKKKTD